MGGGGGISNAYEASMPFAEIARAQWRDYKKRFMPVEDKLIAEGTDQTQYIRDPRMAADSVNNAYNTQSGATTRDLGRMGITMSPEEQSAANDSTLMNRTQALVANQNSARMGVTDRIAGVMDGGLSAADRTIRK